MLPVANVRTVADLARLFLAWAPGNCAPGTVEYYRRHLERFAAFTGTTPLEELKPFHLTSWESRWHPLQAVQRLFAWAEREAECIDRNPFARVKRPPIGQRRRILSRQDSLRLMRAAAPDFRAVLMAMRESIARPQEVRALDWQSLRWVGGEPALAGELLGGRGAWFLDEFKARRRRADPTSTRIIPISPRIGRLVVRLLRRRPARHGWVFLNSRGAKWTTNAARLRMAALRQRVGLGADHRGERIVLYTMRHTAATEACSLGVRDRLLADLMGHSSTRTTARYQHLQADHLLAAMQELHWKRHRPHAG